MSKKSNHSVLTSVEQRILQDSIPGVAHEAVALGIATRKANIASQNADTGLPSYNAGDSNSYERANLSAGFHKSSRGSK